MGLIKCDKCGETFSTNFCSDCGRNREDIKVKLPIMFDTYVHSNGENGEFCEELGIDSDSKLAEKINYLNYEVKIVYKIEGDNIRAVQVDTGDGLCDLIPVKK